MICPLCNGKMRDKKDDSGNNHHKTMSCSRCGYKFYYKRVRGISLEI